MTIEELAKSYKDFREECGFKDPVALNEIEVAYEEGAYKVLEEIERILTNSSLCIDERYDEIESKVIELLGRNLGWKY